MREIQDLGGWHALRRRTRNSCQLGSCDCGVARYRIGRSRYCYPRSGTPLNAEVEPLMGFSPTIKQFLDCDPDVARDLPQQRWRDVTPRVEGDSRSAPVGMPVLLMGPALTDADKPQPPQQRDDFARPEDGDRAHAYATRIVWIPTNSDSSFGSPSSRSISTTSWRFRRSSSRPSP